VGRRLVAQAEEKLAQGTIDIIVLSLEQYYADSVPNGFPFDADVYYSTIEISTNPNPTWNLFEDVGTVVVGQGYGDHLGKYASSEALFYFLYKSPNSQKIIQTIIDTQISNKGSDNKPLMIEVPTGSITPIDLVRFIDPWGTALRYTYTPGDTFPVIESAGADKVFATTGDNVTSK
jgi:hypothetical protein